MKKTIKIEGMSCNHCVMRVKKSLEELVGVEKADVSLDNNEAIVNLSDDLDEAILEKAVSDAGYTVHSIE